MEPTRIAHSHRAFRTLRKASERGLQGGCTVGELRIRFLEVIGTVLSVLKQQATVTVFMLTGTVRSLTGERCEGSFQNDRESPVVISPEMAGNQASFG